DSSRYVLVQAEDSIRDRNVTGVQTCALPIYGLAYMLNHGIPSFGYRVEAPYKSGKINVEALKKIGLEPGPKYQDVKNNETFEYRSEERRVGKENRTHEWTE